MVRAATCRYSSRSINSAESLSSLSEGPLYSSITPKYPDGHPIEDVGNSGEFFSKSAPYPAK